MENRVKFQNELETLTPNVYFQPPSNIAMKYPCIVYSRSGFNNKYASDIRYNKKARYSVTVIDKNPDSPLASKVEAMMYCQFDRQYVSDGLNHFTFVINY